MSSFPFHSCGLSGSAGAFAVALSSPVGLAFLHDIEIHLQRNPINMYNSNLN